MPTISADSHSTSATTRAAREAERAQGGDLAEPLVHRHGQQHGDEQQRERQRDRRQHGRDLPEVGEAGPLQAADHLLVGHGAQVGPHAAHGRRRRVHVARRRAPASASASSAALPPHARVERRHRAADHVLVERAKGNSAMPTTCSAPAAAISRSRDGSARAAAGDRRSARRRSVGERLVDHHFVRRRRRRGPRSTVHGCGPSPPHRLEADAIGPTSSLGPRPCAGGRTSRRRRSEWPARAPTSGSAAKAAATADASAMRRPPRGSSPVAVTRMSKPGAVEQVAHRDDQAVRQQQHVEEQRADGGHAEDAERRARRLAHQAAPRERQRLHRRASRSALRRSSAHEATHRGRHAERHGDRHAGERHRRRDADEDQRRVVAPLEEAVDERLGARRRARGRTPPRRRRRAALRAATCTRMRPAGRPISRSTPTVSRRSSTSMIVSASRNTVAATMVTSAIARWKRSSTRNGPPAPAASPVGRASTPGIRAFTSRAKARGVAPDRPARC